MKTKSILILFVFISASCFLTAQSPVKLTPCTTPTVTISGPTEICQGQGGSVTLCASGGTNYSWGGSDTTSCITINAPPASITFTLQVSNPPCYKDTTVTIIVDTMPRVRITGDLLCHGDSTIIHVANGYGYMYLWNTGATTDSIVGILDSTYHLTVTKGACAKDSITVTVTRGCLGIQEISNQSIASIYPNPCSNTLNIDFENQPNLSSIQITDITGRVLLTDHCKLTIDHYSIDISSLSTGMYFLLLNSFNTVEVKKFIKVK